MTQSAKPRRLADYKANEDKIPVDGSILLDEVHIVLDSDANANLNVRRSGVSNGADNSEQMVRKDDLDSEPGSVEMSDRNRSPVA